MLRTLLILLAGLAGLVLMLFFFKGVLYVADVRTALEQDVTRPGPPLSAAFPPVAGWAADDLAAARERAAEAGATALVVLHRGRLVGEWGRTHEATSLGEARASVVSLLWGIGRARGVVAPDAAPPRLADDAARADALAAWLAARAGRPLGELVDAWLASPLGMVDFAPDHVSRDEDPGTGAVRFDLRFSPRDLARLGQLVLDGGRWRGRQVAPADWIEASTGPVAPRGDYGRGHWGDGWLVPESRQVESRGRGGQRLHVDRLLDLVVVSGVLSGDDTSERAVWTVFGGRLDGGDFQRVLDRVKRAGGLGRLDPRFAALVDAGDVEAARAHVQALRAANPDTFVFTEAQLNELGYELLRDDRVDDAIAVFRLNAETFPGFFNTHDSLGEAHYEAGDLERARACYERALALNPRSDHARRMLRRIEREH